MKTEALDDITREPSLVAVQAVSFAYRAPGGEGGRRPALVDISLALQPHEYVTVLGHNGSGKSTLARLLNGLLLPQSGRVLIDGLDTREAASDPALLRRVRQTVGLVFQNPDNQIVATIVEEDVAFGPENLGLPRDEIRRRVEESLTAVELSDLRARPPHQLSGGQRQRVAIAGILAMRPRVLVLDESTAMLDPEGRREVVEVARRLNQEIGTTVLHITHFMAEAVLADRVLVMANGSVGLEGSPAEVFSQVERLKELHLDVPQVTQIAHRLRGRVPVLALLPITVEQLASAVQAAHATVSGVGSDVGGGQATGSTEATVATHGQGTSPFRQAQGRLCTTWGRERPARQGARLAEETAGETGARRRVAPLVEVEDLWHTYGEGTPLRTVGLRGASFRLEAGEIAGIIGHTGSGKSTLVQHLNGLYRPQRGRVVVAGHDLGAKDVDLKLVRRTVGLVFQFPEQQLFESTVGDDIAFGPRRQGASREEVRRRVREAMEAVGLGFEAFKDRYTFGLSGGEMRRVAIAGVLALEPRVLVLDEPTASLDPRGRDELLQSLVRLHREREIGVVFVSHNMDEVAELVQTVWVIAGGRTLLGGPVREVFARHADTLYDHGLGLPQVAEVARELRSRGVPILHPATLSVDEAVRDLARALGLEDAQPSAKSGRPTAEG